MTFTIKHPTDDTLTAEYAWDHALGYFATVIASEKVRLEYDVFQVGVTTLRGVLEFLATHGFIQNLDDALAWLSNDETGHIPVQFRGALNVLAQLKSLNG